MTKQLRFKTERPLVLGEHTPLSIAQSSGKWKDIPYLKDNHGMLPPNMIVVGDRRRVLAATRHLFRPMMLQLEAANDNTQNQAEMKEKLRGAIVRIKHQLAIIEQIYQDRINLRASHEDTKKLYRSLYSLLNTVLQVELDRRRVEPLELVARILNAHKNALNNPTTKTIMQNIVSELLAPAGRVDAAVGLYIHKNKPIPLTILETQMGMSGQDINAWEQLVGSLEGGYAVDNLVIPANSINSIRAGTCGGIIISEDGSQLEEPFLAIGDVIIASSSIADGATVRQRAGFWTAFDQAELDAFREFWAREGLEFTEDGKWPVLHSSRAAIEALDSSCRELKLRIHHGANMSKDSLYLEGDEERTMDLRRNYYCFSTEMEHFGLAYLTHELTKAGIPATNGLVSTVVGTVPGGSFAEPGSKEEKLANETQSTMLEASMRALWKMSYEA